MPQPLTFAAAQAALYDPTTPPELLADIAAGYPSLRAQVAGHPQAYPDLILWIATHGAESGPAQGSALPAEAAPTVLWSAVDDDAAGWGVITPTVPYGEFVADEERQRSRRWVPVIVFSSVVILLVVVGLLFGVPGTGYDGFLRDRHPVADSSVAVPPATAEEPPVSSPTLLPAASLAPTASATPAPNGVACPLLFTDGPSTAFATYGNPRYGFHSAYPVLMERSSPPRNGDGQNWTLCDGAISYTVSAIHRIAATIAEDFDELESATDIDAVTYRYRSDTHLVLSGYTAGIIYYEATWAAECGVDYSLRWVYPPEAKPVVADWVDYTYRSFTRPQVCGS